MKKALLGLAVVAVMSGCGESGHGVNAGSGAGTAAAMDAATAKSSGIFASSETTNTIKTPAFTLISDAIFSGYDLAMMGAGSRQSELYQSDDPAVKSLVDSVDTDAIFRKVQLDGLKENIKNGVDPRFEIGDVPEAAVKAAKAGKPDDEIMAALGGKTENKSNFRAAMAGCMGPLNGWEVDAIGNKAETKKYMKIIAADCDFANKVFSAIYAKLPGNLGNEESAKAKILDAFNSLPTEQLTSALEKSRTDSKSWQFGADLTGFKGVHFTGSAGDFQNTGSGFKWEKGGAAWFGGGYFGGKNGELAVASSLGTEVKKTKEVREGIGSGAETKTGTDANVK